MNHLFKKNILCEKLLGKLYKEEIIDHNVKLKFEIDDEDNVEYLAVDFVQFYFQEEGTQISFYADYGPIIWLYNEEDRFWNDEDIEGMIIYEGKISLLSDDEFFALVISIFILLYKAESVFVVNKINENNNEGDLYHKSDYQIFLNNNKNKEHIYIGNLSFYLNYENVIAEYDDGLHVDFDCLNFNEIKGLSTIDKISSNAEYAIHYCDESLFSNIRNTIGSCNINKKSFNLYLENKKYVLCLEGRTGDFNVFFCENIIIMMINGYYIFFTDNLDGIDCSHIEKDKIIIAGIKSTSNLIKNRNWEWSIRGIDVYNPNLDDVFMILKILIVSELLDISKDDNKYIFYVNNNSIISNEYRIGNIFFKLK